MVNVRALLKLSYIENFRMKDLSDVIIDEFDKYNYKVSIAQSYIDSMLGNRQTEHPETNKKGKTDSVLVAVEKRQKILKEIEEFERKVKDIKSVLNDDELIVFHYCIEERETNEEVCDRMCKSMKTFLHIKKSCYVKVALRLNLTKKLEKAVLKAINQLG